VMTMRGIAAIDQHTPTTMSTHIGEGGRRPGIGRRSVSLYVLMRRVARGHGLSRARPIEFVNSSHGRDDGRGRAGCGEYKLGTE
jgi:hypothetical protein